MTVTMRGGTAPVESMMVRVLGPETARDLTEARWGAEPAGMVARALGTHGVDPVAACSLYRRTVCTPTLHVPAVGIGRVYVRPDVRSIGVGLGMLRGLLAVLRVASVAGAPGAQVAVLHARQHADLYTRAGFMEVVPHLWVAPLVDGLVVQPQRHAWWVEPEGWF